MLRFFRNIRQKLIEQDKIRKYIWYALGEILLVMIGILLALQINNWNETNKDRELMAIALTSLISDLEQDKLELTDEIEFIKNDLNEVRGFKQRLSKPGATIDTLKQIARFEYTPFFDPSHEVNRSTIISILNTGNIDLFDPKIKKKILTHNFRQLELVKIMDLNVQIWIAAENSSGINIQSENTLLDDAVVRGPLLDRYWETRNEDELLADLLNSITNKLIMHSIILRVKGSLLEETTVLIKNLSNYKETL